MNKKRKSQMNRYCKVPNKIILISCTAEKKPDDEALNDLLLSSYLYANVNANYADNNIVDTNISLIQNTVANYGRKFTHVNKIRNNLKYLGSKEVRYIEYRYKIDNARENTRLQFYVNPLKDDVEGGYTIFDFDEYHYLVDLAYNQQITKDDDKRSYNTTNLINLYAYYKMRIMQYQAMNSNGEDHYMNESHKTMARKFHKSNNTISGYVNKLVELGMLKRVEEEVSRPGEAFSRKKKKTETVIRGYTLSDKWRDNFEAVEMRV